MSKNNRPDIQTLTWTLGSLLDRRSFVDLTQSSLNLFFDRTSAIAPSQFPIASKCALCFSTYNVVSDFLSSLTSDLHTESII